MENEVEIRSGGDVLRFEMWCWGVKMYENWVKFDGNHLKFK